MQRLIHFWEQWIALQSIHLAIMIVIIWLISVCAGGASARFRHALWLLVLVKILLPPSVAAPWSLTGVIARTIPSAVQKRLFSHKADPLSESFDETAPTPATEATQTTSAAVPFTWESPVHAKAFFVIWIAGVVGYALLVAVPYVLLMRRLRKAQEAEEGPLAVRVQELGLRLNLRHCPTVIVSPDISSPFLYGVIHPRIALPQVLLQELSSEQLDKVLLHELMHCKRRDMLIGWWQVAVQALFWFHPFVWFANGRLREAREQACDEQIIAGGLTQPRPYADTLLQVLMISRGRSSATPGFLGIFEPQTQLQNRLEKIMNQEHKTRAFGALGIASIVFVAAFLLPMSVPNAGAQNQPTAQSTVSPPAGPPRIVSTSPAVGSVDVDPSLSAIQVTFDRDMGGGMSWTGGGPEFPTSPEGAKAAWINRRTCALPVKLEAGKYYRVGINAQSFQNFRSATGEPAPISAIYFATKGASEEIQSRVRIPKIVSVAPPHGATDVDPSVKEMRVTFDVPMGGGMSWTGGGPEFPEIPPGGKAAWTEDRKTCVMPVTLQPGHQYRLGFNSVSYKNFQSAGGVPLEPVVYTFRTR